MQNNRKNYERAETEEAKKKTMKEQRVKRQRKNYERAESEEAKKKIIFNSKQ